MPCHFIMYLTLIASTISCIQIDARPFRVFQVPHGNIRSCQTCHVEPGGDRNPFGQDIERLYLTSRDIDGDVLWTLALALLDSDGDGFTNGEELQDASGRWKPLNPFPGDTALVTHPGDARDYPARVFCELQADLATVFSLTGNYPNPFLRSTFIEFSLAEHGITTLDIFNLAGIRVRRLAECELSAGYYTVKWNGHDDEGRRVAPGVYLCQLASGPYVGIRRVVMMR
jgi:hypothetical protein